MNQPHRCVLWGHKRQLTNTVVSVWLLNRPSVCGTDQIFLASAQTQRQKDVAKLANHIVKRQLVMLWITEIILSGKVLLPYRT